MLTDKITRAIAPLKTFKRELEILKTNDKIVNHLQSACEIQLIRFRRKFIYWIFIYVYLFMCKYLLCIILSRAKIVRNIYKTNVCHSPKFSYGSFLG